ncbi:MAG TPA: hypothetical protein VEB01_17255, partial [Methylocaldum sp.]|nr:hypothetical protein [Methylocaldum sp.]
MKLLSLAAPSLFALVVLAGCASSNVTERQPYEGERVAKPDRIIVHDFAATPADAPSESALAGRSVEHPMPQTAEEISTGRRLGAQVAQELVAEIRNMGLPAVQAVVLRHGSSAMFGHVLGLMIVWKPGDDHANPEIRSETDGRGALGRGTL